MVRGGPRPPRTILPIYRRVRNPGRRPVQFRLGMPPFQLGAAFAGQLDLVREAQEVAQSVAAACDEAVHAPALLGVAKVWDADPFFTGGDPAFPTWSGCRAGTPTPIRAGHPRRPAGRCRGSSPRSSPAC